MQILIAEDDAVSRMVLQRTLAAEGHQVVAVSDGAAAWELLQLPDAPKMAILDWMMPGLDGTEICRRVRTLARSEPTYLILLTAKQQTEDIVQGLESGANDYIAKPFNRSELRARIRVGERVVALQYELSERISKLEAALALVNQLQGLLPICCYCKRIRQGDDYWQQVESYMSDHADVRFSHGVCPECFDREMETELGDLDLPPV